MCIAVYDVNATVDVHNFTNLSSLPSFRLDTESQCSGSHEEEVSSVFSVPLISLKLSVLMYCNTQAKCKTKWAYMLTVTL